MAFNVCSRRDTRSARPVNPSGFNFSHNSIVRAFGCDSAVAKENFDVWEQFFGLTISRATSSVERYAIDVRSNLRPQAERNCRASARIQQNKRIQYERHIAFLHVQIAVVDFGEMRQGIEVPIAGWSECNDLAIARNEMLKISSSGLPFTKP
jgi:hypothetical protein